MVEGRRKGGKEGGGKGVSEESGSKQGCVTLATSSSRRALSPLRHSALWLSLPLAEPGGRYWWILIVVDRK